MIYGVKSLTKGWFPYDRRRSRIADRRSQKVLRSSAIIWKPTSAIVCDRLRSCDRDRRRSQKIEPCSIFCDRLRSFAILRSYGNQSSAICDRNVSHNNFNSDLNDSTLYVRYCSVRNTTFSQQCVVSPKFLSLH